MKRVTILLALTLMVAGTACTQNNNHTSTKRVYRHGSYVQTGSNIPAAYREYGNSAGDLSGPKVQRQPLQNFHANAGTMMLASRDKDTKHL